MPTIGDEVWIGVNTTIVGKVTIGDDVLIAPNAFVNCDIPSHSVVFGNPCIIKDKENATEGIYIIRYSRTVKMISRSCSNKGIKPIVRYSGKTR